MYAVTYTERHTGEYPFIITVYAFYCDVLQSYGDVCGWYTLVTLRTDTFSLVLDTVILYSFDFRQLSLIK